MKEKDVIGRAVGEAFAALPAEFRAKITNLAVIVEDYPTDEDLEALDGTPGPDGDFGDPLGYLDGPSLLDRSVSDPYELPTRLVLFSGVIADEAEDTDGDVERVTRETVWHEVAHYFGFGEDGAYALEKKWEEKWRESRKQ